MKKMAPFLTIGFTLFGIAGCNFALFSCENNIIRETSSPDNKWKAVAFSRDCGATTSESVQISILNEQETLNDEATGNVFIADKFNPSIKWLSATKLEITIPAPVKISQQKARFDIVSVIYKREK
mgnify:FL=1